MNTHNLSHGQQRITAKALADAIGVPTIGHVRMQNGKHRKTPRKLEQIRVDILERTTGRSQGFIRAFGSAAAFDEYLALCTITYKGGLGRALQASQSYIKASYDLLHEANQLWLKADGKTVKTQLKTLQEIDSLYAMAEQYQRAAKELQDSIARDGAPAVDAMVKAADRRAYAAHEKRLAATSELTYI